MGDFNRAFWTGGENGQLLIQFCDSCSRWVHPPAAACPDCESELVAKPVSGLGEVYTFTINAHQYNPAVPPPYVVAIVELPEQAGLRLPANIVGIEPSEVRIGMPVQVQFDPQRDGIFVPVFAPRTQ